MHTTPQDEQNLIADLLEHFPQVREQIALNILDDEGIDEAGLAVIADILTRRIQDLHHQGARSPNPHRRRNCIGNAVNYLRSINV